MMKLVINDSHGGFGLSAKACALLCEKKGLPAGSFSWHSAGDVARHDGDLVAVVEELGRDASGILSRLAVIEIPDDVDYVVQEYDGLEWVAERHRTWHAGGEG